MSESGLEAGSDVEESEILRVGLNGFGRIGRSVFRAVLDDPRVELVGINDIMDREEMAYLAKYDTIMGPLDDVSLEDESLAYRDTSVPLYNIKDPSELPWDDLDVDVAFESTGIFRDYDGASNHLDAGAEKVLISAPPKGDKPVKQLVYGVNHEEYDGESIVSNASCTTNSVTPVAKVLNDTFGIDSGILTTVHAYTGTQNLVDGPSSKPRRRRAAAENIIPTTTGAAKATTKILPELEGKLDGQAMRVPVPNGSITDLTVDLNGDPSVEEINETFRSAADAELAGVLAYTDEAVVSSDVIGRPFSSTVDLEATQTVGDGALAKILTWYDNEFGFANRMLDVGAHINQN